MKGDNLINGRRKTRTTDCLEANKYPPETEVQEGSGGEEGIQETVFTLFGPKYQGPGEFTDGFGITLAVIKNPNNKTPVQFAQEYYQQSAEDINNQILEGDISPKRRLPNNLQPHPLRFSVFGVKFFKIDNFYPLC